MTRVSDGRIVSEDEILLIETVTAYVALDPGDKIEGILAFKQGDEWRPMVGADHEMLVSLQPLAEQMAQSMGLKVSMVQFTERKVLVEDILIPGGDD